MNSKQILEREFLEIRAKILQIAASLDRMERADGNVDGDSKMELLREGLAVLNSDSPGRAEKVQMLFSRAFDETWKEQFQLAKRD